MLFLVNDFFWRMPFCQTILCAFLSWLCSMTEMEFHHIKSYVFLLNKWACMIIIYHQLHSELHFCLYSHLPSTRISILITDVKIYTMENHRGSKGGTQTLEDCYWEAWACLCSSSTHLKVWFIFINSLCPSQNATVIVSQQKCWGSNFIFNYHLLTFNCSKELELNVLLALFLLYGEFYSIRGYWAQWLNNLG